MTTETVQDPRVQVQPHDHGAEQIVLGSMLLDPATAAQMADTLTPDDFHDWRNRDVFTAALELIERGAPVQERSIIAHLIDTGQIQRIGQLYPHELVEAVPVAATAPYYATRVAELAERRRGIETLTAALRTLSGTGETRAVMDQAEAMLGGLFAGGGTGELVKVGDLLDDATAAIAANNETRNPTRGLTTGLVDLDHLIGGFRPGQLITVAGRPGMGKSLVALGFARAAAKTGAPSIFYTLEMTALEVALRLLSAESGVLLKRLREGGMDDNDWTRLARRAGDLTDMPLWICDKRNISITEIAAAARRHQRRHGLGLLVVDYLQLLSSPGRHASRVQEVSDMTRRLKNLAGELGVPLIMLSQLNRNNESRGDKRPQMSDLRESGSVEQDSDCVILLHRDDYYDPETSHAGEIELAVPKSRDTATGTVIAAAQFHMARVESMAI